MNNIRPALLMMFRDEADILEQTLTHWRDLGIQRFYLCDNSSKDNSADIAANFADTVRMEYRTNWPASDVINTLKADAQRDGYNWIFPVDADEQIALPEGCDDLYDYIRCLDVKTDFAIIELDYLNIYPNGKQYIQGTHRKVFGKFRSGWEIAMGNHLILNQPPTHDPKGAYYKHYGIRGYDQFRTKMINYMEAFNQMPFPDHPHAQSYHLWQAQGESYIEQLYQNMLA
jgi:glycosyltransferase involved in cell wall biosynthesis